LLIAAAVCGVLLLAGLIAAWWVYRATQRPVPWYEELLVTDPEEAEVAGDELERQALALVSDVKRPDDEWAAVFTDDQINGWLAVDLVENYSEALPDGVSDPRVAIDPGGARVACRYEGPRLSSVVNTQTEIYLTGELNEVAVRIRSARAGAMPLPLARLFDQATKLAQERGIAIRWIDQQGDPVALLTLPDEYSELPGRLLLETLVLREGEVYVAGRTVPRTQEEE
jgi:hypothetical protein